MTTGVPFDQENPADNPDLQPGDLAATGHGCGMALAGFMLLAVIYILVASIR